MMDESETIEHLSYAREACIDLILGMVERVEHMPEGRHRTNVFSAMLGVVLGNLRDATVRLKLSDPLVAETVASIEVARHARKECEASRTESAVLERLKTQVPS